MEKMIKPEEILLNFDLYFACHFYSWEQILSSFVIFNKSKI